MPPSLCPVLLLAYYYPPMNASGSQRAFRLAKYLPQFGYDPYVICADSPEHRTSPAPRVQPVAESSSGLAHRTVSVVQKILDRRGYRLGWVSPATQAALKWLSRHPESLIFSTYPPLCTHLTALRLKSRMPGHPWVADFRDPLAGSAFLRGRLSRRLDAYLEASTVRAADAILLNTAPASEELAARYPGHSSKLLALYNGYDPEDSFEALALDNSLSLGVTHVGDCYGPRHPAILLESFERLAAAGKLPPGACPIRLIGPLDDGSPFRSHPLYSPFRERGWVSANESLVPKSEASRLTAAAARLMLLDLTGRDRNVQIPAKIFDYIRVGRPILAITTPNSPAEKVLAVSEVPHVCLYTNEPPLRTDAKVLEFFSLPTDPQPFSRDFANQFDARTQAKTLAALLDKLKR